MRSARLVALRDAVARRSGLLAVLALILAWEGAAHLVPQTLLSDAPLVPSWEHMFSDALLGMADYWRFEFWAPRPSAGGEPTLAGALLAIAYHSAVTLGRLLSGFAIGAVVGTLLGLMLSWSGLLRHMALGPLTVLRMCPMLAMVPLFQFWIGADSTGVIVFVAYAVGMVYLAGTLNAVANVTLILIERARTLGASPWQVYAHVIVPAILPELAATVVVSLGLSWSAVIVAEYIGIDTGIGRILIYSQFLSQTGRMGLITVLVIVYAGLSLFLFKRLSRRLLAWV